MALKTTHEDTHGDTMVVYSGADTIFIDGKFNDLSPEFGRTAWRGVFDVKTAREIAKRLNDLTDILEGK